MIDVEQLIEHVIYPSLKSIGMYSGSAVNLLVGTAAVESNLGQYIHQVGGGPACGIWQMEPKTYDDIVESYLSYRHELTEDIADFLGMSFDWDGCQYFFYPSASEMCGNMYLACIFARLHYFRAKEALPAANDIEGQARYWKQYYNTPLGAGTELKYIKAYPL